MKIRIGSRNSKLALIQTQIVVAKIRDLIPDLECEVIPMQTSGDKVTNINLYDIGGKALFLKELEEQLIDNKIDLAVHSLKDVPGIIPDQLKIMAVLQRDDPRDCFVSHKYKSIDDLPKGAIVGSSSVRRKVIMQERRPDLKIVLFRGNINTRLIKLHNEEVDATILACAGLHRSKLFDTNFCFPISSDQMLPAAGQGVITIEARADNLIAKNICNIINHEPTWHLSQAERSFMTYLDASCRTPMSAYAIYEEENIKVKYMLADTDGKNIRYTEKYCKIEEAYQVGIDAAKYLQQYHR